MKGRIKEIDVASGIAILLVVYAHLLFEETGLISWYKVSRDIIYLFHMPFFIFISGILVGFTTKEYTNNREYSTFLVKKIKKFLPPYLLFATIFIFAENLSGKGSWQNLPLDIFDTILRPPKSPAGFLWYIYVLFIFYAIFPFLLRFTKRRLELLLLPALLLQFINLTPILSLNQIGEYSIFFLLGAIASLSIEENLRLVKKYGIFFLSLFIIVLVSVWQLSLIDLKYSKLILGMLSLPSLLYISTILKDVRMLNLVGKNSFYIYLMNTLIGGILYLTLVSFLNFKPGAMLILVMFIIAAAGPIVVKKYIINRVPLLQRLIP